MNGQDIITRFQRLVSDRQVIQETWDYIERYITPYRGRFFKDERSEPSIEWRKPFVYDSTAVMAAQSLSASLHSSLTSPSTQWFGLRFRADELNENVDAVAWLEACGKEVYHALQDSNFNAQVNETYTDIVGYGTSVIVEEEIEKANKFDSVNFKSVPIKEAYFEQDVDGNILNFYRHLKWTPRQWCAKFGDDCPEDITEMANDASSDPDRKVDLIFCIYRRMDIPLDTDIGKPKSPENRPYGWCYVRLNDAMKIGEGGGYYEMPAFIPRWRKTSESMWGNSPAMIALSDTMTLNRMIELNLSAVEKALDPPTLTTQRGLIGDLDLTAGGLTLVRDVNEITPYESRARFDISYQEMNRLRENIDRYFFIPQLVLPPMQGTPATATEISVRMQQLERLIGPTLGRLQSDLLDPLITRTFRILLRAGRLPEVPEIIGELGGQADIEYTGPMAKTQEASNMQAIERWAMFVSNLAQFNQDVMDVPQWDEMIKMGAAYLGVPAKLIKSQSDIDSERGARKEQEQMMAQGQAMQDMGQGMQAMDAASGGQQ